MKLKHIPVEDALQTAWGIVKKNFWFLLGLMVIIAVISTTPNSFQDLRDFGNPYMGQDSSMQPRPTSLYNMLMGLVGTVFDMGLITIMIKLIDGKKVSYADLFENIRRFFHYLATNILYTIIVFAGVILFIIPGIIAAIAFQYAPYLVLDKKMGIMEAFSTSARMTSEKRWELFIFGIVLICLNIVGLLLAVIGLLWTVPTVWLANAYMYRHLSKQLKKSEKQPETELVAAE